MQIAEIIFVIFLTSTIFGGVGFLIGRNRKIGGTWSFTLGAILRGCGWIMAAYIYPYIGGVWSYILGAVLGGVGWIVACISPKVGNSSTTCNKRGTFFELALSWILLIVGLIAFLLGITAMGNGAGVVYIVYVILGVILCGLGGMIMKK